MEQNKKLSKSNRFKMIVLATLIFVMAVSGITYAYFTIQITGNDTASSMRIKTSNLSLVYNDVQIRSGSNVDPGWSSESKTLTVYNDGNVTAHYNIIWRDLYNTIINDELLITATCVSSSGTCSSITDVVIPTINSEGHNILVKSNIEIPAGVTHTYTVTVNFIDTGALQNYNQRKGFYGTLNISEGLGVFKRNGTDSTTGIPLVKIGTEEFYDLTNVINYTSLMNTNGDIYNYASGKSILFAKYNLYVGQIVYYNGTITPINISTAGYGLQNEEARGNNNIVGTTLIGGVPFSNTIYWNEWTQQQRENVYSTTYSSTDDWTDSSYSIAYYVEEYVRTLGISNVTGRLLTYTEATSLEGSYDSILYGTGSSSWLGSVENISSPYEGGYFVIYTIDRKESIGNRIGDQPFRTDSWYGVRPVIVVNTTDIQSN